MDSSLVFFAILLLGLISLFALRLQTKKKPDTVKPSPQDFRLEASEEIGLFTNQKAPHPAPEIPTGYNDVRLTLLVRDPEWIYAYWEVSPYHWEEITKRHGRQASFENLTLRVVELGNDMDYFDLKVGKLVGGWHIHVPRPSTAYYAVMGLGTRRNFIPLIVSNVVTTPRNDFSILADEEWMLVNDYEQRIIKYTGLLPVNVTSPFMFRKD